MSTNHWVPVQSPVLHDVRIGRLHDAAHRLFITSLLLCGHEKTNGSFPRTTPTPADIAWHVRMDDQTAQTATDELIETGRWLQDDAGCWSVADFTDFVYLRAPSGDAAASGSQGGHARWHDTKHVPEQRYEPNCPKCRESRTRDDRLDGTSATAADETAADSVAAAVDALLWNAGSHLAAPAS